MILNDFRLSVPVEELEAYGTMLVQFYAREAMANASLQIRQNPTTPRPLSQQQQPDRSVNSAGAGAGAGAASA